MSPDLIPINPMRAALANPFVGILLAPLFPIFFAIQMITSIQEMQQEMLKTMIEMQKLQQPIIPIEAREKSLEITERKAKIIDIKRDEKGNIISIIEY